MTSTCTCAPCSTIPVTLGPRATERRRPPQPIYSVWPRNADYQAPSSLKSRCLLCDSQDLRQPRAPVRREGELATTCGFILGRARRVVFRRVSGRRPRGHRKIESWAAPDAQRLARAAGELSRGTCARPRRTLASSGCRPRPSVSRTRDDHPIARRDSCATPSSQWRAPLCVSVLSWAPQCRAS